MTSRTRLALCAFAVTLPVFLLAEEKIDLSVIYNIKDEAFNRSKVMDEMFYLTDVNGPRLTNSPAYFAAAKWAAGRLTEYGLTNVKLEKWGPFGRSWVTTRFAAHMLEPQYTPLIGYQAAWSGSTNGPVIGEPIIATLATDADLEKWKRKLNGKIVMTQAARELLPHAAAESRRYTDDELLKQSMAPEPGANPFRAAGPPTIPGMPADPAARFGQMRQFRVKLNKFLADEGAAMVLQSGMRGDGGTIFVQQAGSQDPKTPVPPPTVIITPEHYNRIARLLEHKIPVKIEIDAESKILDETDSVNVIGEIPGGAKKDEIVMLGGHLDSWHSGTGATDNAAGCAVAMEAVRILTALKLKPERTIRIALWGGEEQGLLGSKAYVKEHFADSEVMKTTAEHAKVAGYFNFDNGTGRIRGIYLQGNDMVRPIFEQWFAPFKDLGIGASSIRNTGGTDHLSFDAVGIPGFQFIQDEVEYNARTHHSNMDVYDRIQKGDLMQASAIMASFVYNTATRPEMLPRKPLPKAQPARRRGEDGAGPTMPSGSGQ